MDCNVKYLGFLMYEKQITSWVFCTGQGVQQTDL
jgi:hypothetical protein